MSKKGRTIGAYVEWLYEAIKRTKKNSSREDYYIFANCLSVTYRELRCCLQSEGKYRLNKTEKSKLMDKMSRSHKCLFPIEERYTDFSFHTEALEQKRRSNMPKSLDDYPMFDMRLTINDSLLDGEYVELYFDAINTRKIVDVDDYRKVKRLLIGCGNLCDNPNSWYFKGEEDRMMSLSKLVEIGIQTLENSDLTYPEADNLQDTSY